jgi:glycosyltransferase involved in cell wall biosynthesis
MLEREDIETLLLELENKYPQEICFSGVVEGEEKEKLFMVSDIFALPSYSEGLPISIIEAMSYGLPIITSPLGALPDYLREGDNCFFVPPGDYVKLSDSLIRLIRNPALRFEIGKRNYEYSHARLSIEHSAKALSEVIAQVSQQ